MNYALRTWSTHPLYTWGPGLCIEIELAQFCRAHALTHTFGHELVTQTIIHSGSLYFRIKRLIGDFLFGRFPRRFIFD